MITDRRGHRPARRGASLGLRIGLPVVALLGTILIAPAAMAAPTAISLGTAGQFAILAGDAITNVPTSVILGDVGVTPGTGAAIGLTCAEVTGAIYTNDLAGPLCRIVDAGLLTTAKNALTAAYDEAAALTPDSTFAGADNQLGTQNLVAGVYRFSAASTANLVGNLTLTGSSSDVWVFQATSTLVTAANSSISFSGGAQACNVFWQVGSAATLGADSDFAGTILAHDDISLGNSVTVDGRLLAGGQANHAGAVTLIADTITRSDCADGGTSPSPTAAGPGTSPTAAAPGTAATAAAPGTSATTTAGPGTTATTTGVVPTQATTDISAAAPTRGATGSLGFVLVLIALAAWMVAYKAPRKTIR